MFFNFNRRNNLEAVAIALLKKLHVPVANKTIEETLQSHPEYPSLFALKTSLNEWGVESSSLRYNLDECSLNDIELPFIAHLRSEGGIVALINEIDSSQVKYTNHLGNNLLMSELEFMKLWDGIVLIAKAKSVSGDDDINANQVKYIVQSLKLPLFLVFLICSFLWLSGSLNFTAGLMLLFLAKSIGVLVSIFLLMHTIDNKNSFVERLCIVSSVKSCGAVLNSKMAKITSWLSWSELGFIYFFGTSLSLFYTESVSVLGVLNLFCLPYTIFSLYYQYKHKSWCMLCCTVQFIFWVEFLIFNKMGYDSSLLVYKNWGVVLFIFGVPFFTWIFLKPLLIHAGEASGLKKQLNVFKYNTSLFRQQLINQPCFEVPDEIWPLVLGKPEAKSVITLIISPNCEACSSAFKVVNEWMENRDDLQLKVVFLRSHISANYEEKTVAYHLLLLSLTAEKVMPETAFKDWYDGRQKDYQKWVSKYPITKNNELSSIYKRIPAILIKQKEWCDKVQVQSTPTILLNGYILPKPYQIYDLKYIM